MAWEVVFLCVIQVNEARGRWPLLCDTYLLNALCQGEANQGDSLVAVDVDVYGMASGVCPRARLLFLDWVLDYGMQT